nr:MAG TPA: homing endonuclease [Caudoviricetes sp.]
MRKIKGFENYLIDEDGTVYSLSSSKVITPYCKKGYVRVRLNKDGKRFDIGVHKLVALTYLEDSFEEGLEVNHKDANRQNNNVDNLEWITHEENARLARNAPITVEYPDGTVVTYPSRTAFAKGLWGEDTSMHNNLPKYYKSGRIPKFGIRILEM